MSKSKRRSFRTNNKSFYYTVTEYDYEIQVRVYAEKNLFAAIRVSYVEAWGINIYQPKFIELFINYVNSQTENRNNKNEFGLAEEHELFEHCIQVFFSDSADSEIEEFRQRCNQFRLHCNH